MSIMISCWRKETRPFLGERLDVAQSRKPGNVAALVGIEMIGVFTHESA
jgi:hypothetical protein